jgi:23S rRNA-/tRNA-specific pseudouridylate synthase
MKLYDIVFEDAAIVAANKLAPLPVQPDKSGDRDLQSLLKAELDSKPAFWRPRIG